MKYKIQNILKKIENDNKIKIIFAIENGSRAWGMESEDSDYDIRFVFTRKPEAYICLDKPKEVINIAYDHNGNECEAKGSLIDISGFDIFKYLKLLSNSNPTTIEWLISNITYIGHPPEELKTYTLKNFNPYTLFKHYKSICQNNYLNFIKPNLTITHKKYLYIFRGLLNALWVYHNNSIPPINFLETIEKSCFLENEIKQELLKIIKLKSQGKEQDNIERIKIFDNYIESFLNKNHTDLKNNKPEKEFFNHFLREIILD